MGKFRRRKTPSHALSVKPVKIPIPNDPTKFLDGFDIFDGDKPLGMFSLKVEEAEEKLKVHIAKITPRSPQ